MLKTAKPKTKVAKKVLVVEDEGEMRLVFDMILNDREIDLDYVDNLLAADEYLLKHKPAVIILDNKLPDGFGVDFISYTRKKYPHIKIIMTSGFASVRDVALQNGAYAFFEKPFALEDFNKTLDKLLK